MATQKPPNAGKGRPKGSLNRKTKLQKDIAAAVVAGNAHRVQEKLDRIQDPARWLEIYLRFLEFIKPKLARAQVETKPPEIDPPQIRISFADGGPGCPAEGGGVEVSGDLEAPIDVDTALTFTGAHHE